MSKQLFKVDIDKGYIESMLYGLENFEKDKALREGLAKSGQLFKRGGIMRLKQRMKFKEGRTGNLLNSFKVRVKKTKLGVLIGFKKSGSHSHFIDRGTDLRKWKSRKYKSGGKKGEIFKKTTGAMPANYFWMDTERQDSRQAIDCLYQGVNRAIDRIKERRR